MEIDSFPDRLDFNDEGIFKARQYNLKFAIDTDSHRTAHMQLMRYGIGTAKRGWLKKEDVINTRGQEEITKLFR
jgi:DNA polymerase (family 10)